MTQIPHRLKLSLRKNRQIAIYCECMAQINDQDRRPTVKVPWRFWGWDAIAVVDLDDDVIAIFRQHKLEYDPAHIRCAPGTHDV